jgi:hypothetical protein
MRTITCLSLSICLSVVLSSRAAAQDEDTDRAKLVGSWQSTPDGGQAWSFSTQGDALKVIETEAGNKVADFTCNTDGKNCDVKIGGKKASVSFYYNGSKLVEIEQKGSDVIKRRFTAAPQTDAMELEVMPIVPSGTNETVKFKRVNTLAKQ